MFSVYIYCRQRTNFQISVISELYLYNSYFCYIPYYDASCDDAQISDGTWSIQ